MSLFLLVGPLLALIDHFIILCVYLAQLLGHVSNLLLQIIDMSLLVLALLRKVWRPYEILQYHRIVIRQIALSVQQVNPVKPVISPTLTHLEV